MTPDEEGLRAVRGIMNGILITLSLGVPVGVGVLWWLL